MASGLGCLAFCSATSGAASLKCLVVFSVESNLMSSWKNGLQSIWEIPEAKFVILGASLVGLVAVAMFAILKARALVFGGSPSLSEHLDDFQMMADQGQLAPEEYRKVRARLRGDLREQMSREAEELG